MRKFYQKEWHSIQFTDFTNLDAFKIADSHFYSAFYQKFFCRYKSYEDLDSSWINHKHEIANFISNKISKGEKVLSIGCGLGIIETNIKKNCACDLEITETSTSPLQWVFEKNDIIPLKKIHVGFFPECLPPTSKFDLIYLSAVDYCFDTQEWMSFLSLIKTRLLPNGRCLVISASFEKKMNFFDYLLTKTKLGLKKLLVFLRRYNQGQFWGFLRSHQDYKDSFLSNNFKSIQHGFIESTGDYWIEGRI